MNDEPETIATIADMRRIEARPYREQVTARNVYEMLCATARAHAARPAVSFQLKGDATARATTLSWEDLRAEVTRAANLLRSLGVGPGDRVACLLPNAPEAAVALLGAMTAGVAAPINPLLESEQISAILRETGAKALITLSPFVRTDISAKASYAVRYAPECRLVLEVDLGRHLGPPLSWVTPYLAPKRVSAGSARVLNLRAEMARMNPDRLDFAYDAGPDDPCACFHTGGTTGTPKVAQHLHRGALYNGWLVDRLLLRSGDAMLCPLPLFHVLAAYPMLMACVASGAHFVMPTPAGYRGEGVMDNFWKLVERWRINFVTTVPTAVAALMQRKVDADISSLRYAISGSAAMPPELFRRFEAETGVKLLEGYGQTETTCLISCNPPMGERRIGSVGLPFPYSQVSILKFAPDGSAIACETDEVGEICVASPGCIPGYLDEARNAGLFAAQGVVRTGDLGRLDADNYLWITGRAKDLIIRGGHNIDPGVIEDALMAHPSVAFVGAVGQPDAYAGELPCAYVELVQGASETPDALKSFAAEHVSERAARPAHVELVQELPKTAVGKIYKPDLRKRALERVYTAALAGKGVAATVRAVDDEKLGVVAEVEAPGADDTSIATALDAFTRPWRRAAD
ncbi:acyl-CoA synthetase [Rubrimonas cliftonensis]|uniref:Fatty-acyl-CoA synthase n=1 Tax=Rubrimonas cliftonensis TaxID=89524 RepID=A0A1H3VII0_9RHOB|nr:acyl-CoA synthetase [Rubrimonas cliftonensis]SDZ74597.1 fatty-acyl-CoA synthase [Rubrimonas cliftonensis]